MTTAQLAADHLPQIGFGDRLRRLRLDLGMDTRRFAQALDMNHATVSRYETGNHDPRNAPHVASTVQLRFGSADLDLRTWLLTGRGPEPTVSGVRHLALVADEITQDDVELVA